MTTTTATRTDRMPLTIWLIAGGIFAMVTSEFMAAGLLPAIAPDVGVPIGQAALLISGFAAGQVIGAWLIGMPLARLDRAGSSRDSWSSSRSPRRSARCRRGP